MLGVDEHTERQMVGVEQFLDLLGVDEHTERQMVRVEQFLDLC